MEEGAGNPLISKADYGNRPRETCPAKIEFIAFSSFPQDPDTNLGALETADRHRLEWCCHAGQAKQNPNANCRSIHFIQGTLTESLMVKTSHCGIKSPLMLRLTKHTSFVLHVTILRSVAQLRR